MAGSTLYGRAIVLGLTIAVGAFAIDMYIPGFAAIAQQLRTDPGTVQLSMTSFFVALAIGQVIYGPVSDTFGRKPPTYAGLVIFIIASIGAAFAPSIQFLILSRFFQGLGAAATAVIPMAIVRDEHTGPDAARLLSLAMLALSVSPILAPVLGGLVVQYASWRLIFLILILITLVVMAMVWRLLPETLPPERRVSGRLLSILANYGRLTRHRIFILPILIAGFAQSVLFSFISGSPFVFVSLHHLRPTTYGVLFAFHAMALIGVSQFNAPLMRRLGARRLLGAATATGAAAALLLAILVFAGMTLLWPFVALTLTIFFCLGLTMGPAFLTAMEPFGATAGAAAALGVGLEFTMSSVTTALMSLAADGTARPMAGSIAIVACGSFAAWCIFMKFVPNPNVTLEPGQAGRNSRVPAESNKTGNAAMSGNQDEDRLRRIREIAYDLWEKEGRPEGREHEFWLRAEEIVDGKTDEARSESEDRLDRESADSFPASDPPSFNP